MINRNETILSSQSAGRSRTGNCTLLELPNAEVVGYSAMAGLQGPTNKDKFASCIDKVLPDLLHIGFGQNHKGFPWQLSLTSTPLDGSAEPLGH